MCRWPRGRPTPCAPAHSNEVREGYPGCLLLHLLPVVYQQFPQKSEFYNFSYNYLNDCLKAGLVFRREFYRDKDLEPVDSLMFKISLIPFADINSPDLQ